MDWKLAVERNGQTLRRVLASLAAMAGFSLLGGGEALERKNPKTLPRRLHRAVLRLLRPAEAAARRLVIIAARGIVVAPPPPRGAWSPSPASQGRTRGGGAGTTWILPRRTGGPKDDHAQHGGGGVSPATQPKLSFALFDRLRLPARWRPPATGAPRLSVPGITAPFPVRPQPTPDDAIDAAHLFLRLEALSRALDDLPAQARRFALWKARRDSGGRSQNSRDPRTGKLRSQRATALRPGRPPGSNRRGRDGVHGLLAELHGLAVWSLEQSRQDREAVLRPELRPDKKPSPDTS